MSWQHRSAQPGDRWAPKRGKGARELKLMHPYRPPYVVVCRELEIEQHWDATKAALVRFDDGERRLIKWSELRRNWKPITVREEARHG